MAVAPHIVTRSVPVLLGLASLVAPAAARAHGDPASESLHLRSVFVPVTADIDEETVARLEQVVEGSGERSSAIRVALISQPYDLGSLFQLYRKPQRYAEYLRRDLAPAYQGRVLVAMPNGFGYAGGGEANPHLVRALAGLPLPGRDPTRLAEGAVTAVRRLAAAAGRPVPPPETSDSSETRDRVKIGAAVAIGLALIGGVMLIRRLRAQRHETA